MSWQVLSGDCLEVLPTLDAGSVQTVVTSPPYWGLRDYGTATWEGGDSECDHKPAASGGPSMLEGASQRGRSDVRRDCQFCGAKRIDSQLGLEPTPEEYVANLVSVFREVRRVLRDDGTVWLNLGDSYATAAGPNSQTANRGGLHSNVGVGDAPTSSARMTALRGGGIKPKDLVGIPWRVAFALQADGWWLRSDIIWSKPNPMPESVTDRPTRAHEYVFLLTKSARYFYDADAVREAPSPNSDFGRERSLVEAMVEEWRPSAVDTRQKARLGNGSVGNPAGRNRRSVWEIATQPYAEAHFATFPPKLVEPCILAGSPPKCCGECGASFEPLVERESLDRNELPRGHKDYRPSRYDDGKAGDPQAPGPGQKITSSHIMGYVPTCRHDEAPTAPSTVLDPFAGAGTTGLVAALHGRDFIGVELSPEYAEMARDRIRRWEANPNGALEGAPEVAEGQLGLLDEQLVSVARRDADHKRQNTPRNDGDRWNRNDGRGF